MTDETIMELPIETLVQLCIMRREDVRAAMKEATRILRYNWRNSTEGRACHAERVRRYREKVKEQNHPTKKATTAPKDTSEIYVSPERRTDRQKLAYWNAVHGELDEMFAAKEIDVETYINQSNIAAIHVLAAEIRMKK